jgi:hypothetical protein
MSVPVPVVIGLIALVTFGAMQFLYIARYRTGSSRPRFRAISAFSSLRGQMGRAIESGRDLHVSIGTGSISGEDTATTLAGIAIVEYLAEEAGVSGIAPVTTTSDPTSLLLAHEALRRPYVRQGDLSNYPHLSARLTAVNPMQYAGATMDLLNHEPVLANIMSGAFDANIALIDQAAGNNDLPQLSGAADARALAVMTASSDNLLIGEEMYATKAYLSAPLPHLASLRAADIVRILLVVTIVILAGAQIIALLARLLFG